MNQTYRTFGILFVYLILDLISFTIILPLFPTILDRFHSEGEDNGLYQSIIQVSLWFQKFIHVPEGRRWNSVILGGILGSLFSFLQFFSSPIVGALSDVYGRKPMLIITMIGICTSYLMWWYAQMASSFAIFLFSRVIGGLSKANIGVSTAIVSDVSGPAERTRGMAVIGVAFSAAFILGPLTAACFATRLRSSSSLHTNNTSLSSQPSEDVAPAALASIILSFLALVWLLVAFKETLPYNKRTSTLKYSVKRAMAFINPISLFTFSPINVNSKEKQHNLCHLGVTYFLYLLIFSGLEFTLTFLTHIRFSYDSMQQGKMFLFIGVIMIIVQGGIVRRLKPGREKRYSLMSMLLLIPAFVLLGLSDTLVPFYIGLFLFSWSSALVVPCLTSLSSLQVSSNQQGAVMGIFRSLGALARSIGPLFASFAFWMFGPNITYCCGALLLLLPLFYLQRIDV